MRSVFNLSHEHKTSVDMGTLVPVYCDEVLPGDTWIHRATALARVAPLAHPLMHRVELRMHSFYVPNRVLFDKLEDAAPTGFKWENFITGSDDVTPKPTYTTQAAEPVLDYMGIPPAAGIDLDPAPLVAYNLIFNEYYRDQDLQVERGLTANSLANICWQKDYFTVARPDTQQGDPTDIPFSAGQIPVTGLSMGGQTYAPQGSGTFGTPGVDIPAGFSAAGSQGLVIHEDPANLGYPGIYADMSQATAGIAIDDLRQALALQRFAEARMRWGSRHIDYLRFLGVNPSDGRLDRPEYLGGGKEILNFSEVLSTSDTTSANVGDMFGHGIGMGRQNTYRKMFEEHGWVLTLLSARPKTVYQNCLPRKFTRQDVMDYWQPELETLPWQPLSEQEVHVDGDPDTTFGYVPRYEEYRHHMSHVSGSLRGGTENDWHMAREFASPPALNGSFVECTPTERIYQDANQPNLILNIMHDIKAARLVGQTASMGVGL